MKKIICVNCDGERFQLKNDFILEYAQHTYNLNCVTLPVVCLNCGNEFEVEFEPKGGNN